MSATTWIVVYNGGENAQVVDDDGRTCYSREFTHARRSVVRDQIDQSLLMIISPDTITDDSVPAAKMAKEEAQRLNDEIDADKETVAAPKTETPAKASPKSIKTSN